MMGKPYNFCMPGRRTARRGFTLTELLVVVGLFIVLMVAVSSIFTSTSKAVGTGQAISDGMRDLRASQAVFENDMARLLTSNTPGLVITNRRQSAFMSQQDMLQDPDWQVSPTEPSIRTFDALQIGNETDPTNRPFSSPVRLNERNHRVDQIQFFASGRFAHQTSATGYNSPMTADEAYISYGHLWLPDNAGSYLAVTLPGAGLATSNPNNFFATQWVLGRSVILLRRPTGGIIQDDNGVSQNYYAGLASGSTASIDGTVIGTSLHDLAGTTLYDMRLAINATPAWWTLLDYRFQADLNPARPVTSAAMAKTIPAFMPNCTQFAVEFAGDFVTQDPTFGATLGNVIGNTPDGTIDYVVDNGAFRTRWYGFPRNIHGLLRIQGYTAGITNNMMPDVVPLRDVLASGGFMAPTPMERDLPPLASGEAVDGGNYAYVNPATGASFLAPTDFYRCAWGPAEQIPPPGATQNLMPKMIRFVMTVEDPGGKVPGGQTVEYVFRLH